MEKITDKLNLHGRQLHDMLLAHHKLQSLTVAQIERILSFQARISNSDINNGPSRDPYSKRFKIVGKRKHGGYLDTGKFWEGIKDKDDQHSPFLKTHEQVIAQA